ncbi:putative cleft lip and palate associated transmembrane protein [Lyophyllum shimeji]|uniref:Cleft lip and palate associated transmembrane protein n=1 Tax=Lyophyllum shimeji TaxID=47721 RepID=A0A9P3UIF2_LYOSH|nr:putative cleft lip and palate associated transmembrane protein [Lyophyllum shimeji]
MSAPRTAAPAAAGAPAAREEQESSFKKVFEIAQRVLLMWAITSLATKFFAPSTNQPPAAPAKPGESTTGPADAWSRPPAHAEPAWPLGQQLDMHVRLSTAPLSQVFGTTAWQKEQDKGLPKFVWSNITLGDWKAAHAAEFDVKFPKSVLNNGSLWMDVFLTKEGASPDPYDPAFNPENIHHIRKLLTPYLPRIKVRKEKKLLGDSETPEVEEEPEEVDYIVPHWHRNVTLALISDAAKLPYSTLPPPVAEYVHLVQGQRDTTGTIGFYKPIVFPNEFWHLREHYVELNSTTTSLPVRIVFQPMSYMKFQIFAAMTNGFKEAAKQQGGAAAAELDELKRMLIETNPWLLALTGLVSALHVLFEMLAFKSDVSHWRQKKEMIVTNVVVQIIILLYLIDNNENTSWMILFGSGTGVLIEAWKVTKAVDISVVPAPAGSLLPYKLDIKDKHVLSEDEKKTQEYDKLAFRYVSYVAIPLLAGYTIYSLLYNTHRGWYSFVISTLTSFVYMFGFAQLVPQLIINYKLKSVAHMPMKAMIYKTLSTVVDDFFAFCIKMPFLHRLACFRDDVVFLIFLYQRWIYRVDPKRVNEYGQVMVEDVDAVKGQESKKDK